MTCVLYATIVCHVLCTVRILMYTGIPISWLVVCSVHTYTYTHMYMYIQWSTLYYMYIINTAGEQQSTVPSASASSASVPPDEQLTAHTLGRK